MQCPKCFAYLPDGAQTCPKCDEQAAASNPAALAKTEAAITVQTPALPRKRRRVRGTPWLVLAVIVGIIVWIALSNTWAADQIRNYVTGARTQTLVETPFTVKPRSFAQYQFAVPPGAVSVTLTGQFEASGTSDNDIAVYVLTEDAFVVWQTGYSTRTYYESGKASHGTIAAELPSRAGIYYVIFSNGFPASDAKTRAPQGPAKSVHANVLLHYKTWLPEWLIELKNKLWSWLGWS